MGAMKSLEQEIAECGADTREVDHYLKHWVDLHEISFASRCALGLEKPAKIAKCKADFAAMIEDGEFKTFADSMMTIMAGGK